MFGRHNAEIASIYLDPAHPKHPAALAALAQSSLASAIEAHLDAAGAGLNRKGVAKNARISARHLYGILTGHSWASLHDLVGLSLALDARLLKLTTTIGTDHQLQKEADPAKATRDDRRARRQ